MCVRSCKIISIQAIDSSDIRWMRRARNTHRTDHLHPSASFVDVAPNFLAKLLKIIFFSVETKMKKKEKQNALVN